MSKTQLTYTLTQKLTYKLTQKDLSLKDHESPNQPQQKMSFLSPKKGRWRFFLGPTWLPGYPADQTAPNLGTPSRRRKRRPVPLTAHPAPHGVKRWSRHVGWPPLRLESGEDGRDGEKGESFRGAFSLAVLGGGGVGGKCWGWGISWKISGNCVSYLSFSTWWRCEENRHSWHPSFQVNLTLHWTSTFTTRDMSWGRFLSVGKISILIGFFFQVGTTTFH